ncbi:MAG: Rne/Rng family ribonuclease, partial [Thermodesulfobacteriota bacterium]|nr:Rne/Rng family ribonuclease [Thermodesulfobacteriota bacterium]
MSKKMLINASHPEENRVAIVVDGILSELDIEIAGQEQSKGNIYKAVVVRVETGLQAAFVDYGAEKLGFLQIGEVHTKLYPPKDETKSRPRIAEILQRGQEILVQIVKEERGSKGAALTTFLSIPGRYMVLMPDSTTKGVSRKISVDSERRNLKKTMAELDLPERMGYIVRTAGIGKDKDELKRDFDYLVRLFEGIVTRKDQIKAPAQLYQESNLAIRSIRDYFSTEMDEVLIDDPKVYKDTKDFFSLVMPELKHLVKRHRERRPVFSRYQIEEQIEGLSKNQAPLPSGGSIVLDQTEALVAIDVNSGKMSGESGIEATAFKTNLEAAVEVGRQLRLRDLGGLIVIDFIDMRDRKHIREIEHEVRKALKDDKAKVSVGRISQFGLLEMSRQRLKPVLSVGAYLECPHCTGLGQIKSVEAQAVTFLRQAHTAAAKGQIAHIEASVPLEVANYLLNQKRSTISELERQLKLKISLLGRSDLLPGDLELELHKREKEQQDNTRQFTPVSHDNQIEIALAAAQQGEEEAKEQAGEQTENISAETAPEQVTGEEPAEKTKKRRRRRRKKPADSNQEVQEQNQPEASKEAAVEKTQTEQTTQPDIAVAEQNQQEPKAEENSQQESEKPATEKPKPRPRRRSRKKPAVAAETIPSEVEVASEQAQANENTGEEKSQENATATKPAATSTTAQAEEKPQRRPRRTTKKETESSANNTNTTSEVKTVAEETSTETKVVAATDTVSNEKPKTPRAPRRAPKKVPEKTETVSATTTAAEEKPKPRPRRATKKSTDASPVSPDSVPDTKTVAQEKPKRQPRRTTKKAPAATPENKTEPVAETVEKAKVPRRPRKA